AKPSPSTPLSSLALGAALRTAVPAGVVNVLGGSDEVGAWMTAHPAVRKISFTGSVPTGKKIMRAAADDLKRVTLELGGNDPAIVLPDVDPARVAPKLFWGAFTNSGQVCVAIKRLYVHEDIYRPLLGALPVIPWRDLDDALAQANHTHYGLGGSVWSADVAHGEEIAARLECGTAWVNQHMSMSARVPFGGVKWSGLGRENGRWGIEEFCELQVVNAAKA